MIFSIQSTHLKNYSIRNEEHQGKDYIVVPVVMLVEGVHNSANGGKTLHLLDEFSKLPEAWDGVPVTVNHPQNTEGLYVSANTPEIIDAETVGIIYNTMIEDGKLKAEAWIEKEKAENNYPALIETLLSGSPLDVSTGAFTDYDDVTGNLSGESYEHIARNYHPNHLALLPNDTGACSWGDGCGIRANATGGDKLKVTDKVKKALKVLSTAGFAVNEIGFRETSQKIQGKLDGMDTDVKFHNLQEVFDDDFVFSVFGSVEEQLFKRGYTVNADETIEFTGEPIPVTRKVDFVEISANKGKVVKAMSKKDSKSCCPGKVHLLVSSVRFDEDDTVWLDTLNEKALDKLLSDKEKVQVNQEDALEILKDILSDPEKLVAILPESTKSIVVHGLALNKVERDKLIEGITANSVEGGYSAEVLNSKDTAELKTLAAYIKVSSDFSGLGGGSPNVNAGDDGMLLPASKVKVENK